MKIINSIYKCTTEQNYLLVLYALWICRFCLNFYRLSLHLNFWYKIHLIRHYGCASFEIFLKLPTIFFHKIFTFIPKKWFTLNISGPFGALPIKNSATAAAAAPPGPGPAASPSVSRQPSDQIGAQRRRGAHRDVRREPGVPQGHTRSTQKSRLLTRSLA